MRSMQFAGIPILRDNARQFNCSFVIIDNIKAISEVMLLLLYGCGVGFSIQKQHVNKLPEIQKPNASRKRKYVISDDVIGWADSIKALLKSYFGYTNSTIIFDYTQIRPKGAALLTSGGVAPGPGPLRECITKITNILDNKHSGEKLSTIEVYSIICLIADAVLAGGIRRSATIALFSFDDDDMLAAKSGNWWETNPHFGRANNSVNLVRSKLKEKDFSLIWERMKNSQAGEPGYFLTNHPDKGFNPLNVAA